MALPRSKKLNMARDLELFYEIGTMRLTTRTWKKFLNHLTENNAEHTLRVIWIALTLARYEKGADLDKVIKIALVHDISEIRGEDVNYVSRQYVERHEKEAAEDTLRDTAWDAEFGALLAEYEKRASLEARIVKDADNLECDIELKEMAAIGSTLPEALRETRKQVGTKKLFTDSARRFWKAIQTSNPHDWHKHAKNRLNSGDWQK